MFPSFRVLDDEQYQCLDLLDGLALRKVGQAAEYPVHVLGRILLGRIPCVSSLAHKRSCNPDIVSRSFPCRTGLRISGCRSLDSRALRPLLRAVAGPAALESRAWPRPAMPVRLPKPLLRSSVAASS